MNSGWRSGFLCLSIGDPPPGETIMSQRDLVLQIVRENPGLTDYEIHRKTGSTRLPESTTKHLLRLRDALLIEDKGDVRMGRRRWFVRINSFPPDFPDA